MKPTTRNKEDINHRLAGSLRARIRAAIKRDKTTNSILLKSGFKIEDRLKWNPSWKKPDTVELDKNGFMQVWYLDGEEENLNLRAEEKATYSTIQ